MYRTPVWALSLSSEREKTMEGGDGDGGEQADCQENAAQPAGQRCVRHVRPPLASRRLDAVAATDANFHRSGVEAP